MTRVDEDVEPYSLMHSLTTRHQLLLDLQCCLSTFFPSGLPCCWSPDVLEPIGRWTV